MQEHMLHQVFFMANSHIFILLWVNFIDYKTMFFFKAFLYLEFYLQDVV